MKRTVEYYLDLPYTTEILPNGDGTFFAKVKELEGCMTEGDTWQEVYEMIEDAKRIWIEAALDYDEPIPEPVTDQSYSGKLVLRLGARLHRELSESAEKNGISLNLYINQLLASRDSVVREKDMMIETLLSTLRTNSSNTVSGSFSFQYNHQEPVIIESREGEYVVGINV